MTAASIPSDEILLKFVSGSLDPGVRLLVEAHLELRPEARARLAPFEAVGGAFLAGSEPCDMTAGSLDRALARIDRAKPETVDPRPLRERLALGRRRWAGPGTTIAPVKVDGARTKVFLMRIAPGRAMLHHGHSALEWTVILEGSYRDESGHFPAGAFIEETGEDQHRPVVDSAGACVCLIASEGPLVARGLTGIAARWLLR